MQCVIRTSTLSCIPVIIIKITNKFTKKAQTTAQQTKKVYFDQNLEIRECQALEGHIVISKFDDETKLNRLQQTFPRPVSPEAKLQRMDAKAVEVLLEGRIPLNGKSQKSRGGTEVRGQSKWWAVHAALLQHNHTPVLRGGAVGVAAIQAVQVLHQRRLVDHEEAGH